MSFKRANAQCRTALVTGACSGIGLAIARRLATLGYDLVLVSNRMEPLTSVARSLRGAHGIAVHALPLDLARPEAAEELYEATRARGVVVDVLVSNAGVFFFGEVADTDPARATTLLHLHVLTPSLLCSFYGREMRARRRGHVLVVSSISAWRDFPGIAHYGASKKYLRGFARSLRCELGVYGVNVTCLSPGATDTNLYDPSVVPVGLAKLLGVMASPERVADAGLRAMFRGEAECVPGALTRAMAHAAVVAPQAAIDLVRRVAPWLPPASRQGGLRRT